MERPKGLPPSAPSFLIICKIENMRQFKSQFHGGTDKDIIVINCYVPSEKRRRAMTKEQKKCAKQWVKDTLSHAKIMLEYVCK